MVALPDVRQSRAFDCGTAAVRCVLQFWERKLSRPIPCTPLDGTHPGTVQAVLRGSGLKCLSGHADRDILRSLLKLGLPAITLVQKGGEGHYVVVAGVRRGFVYFQCPVDGPSRERWEDFSARWADVDLFGTVYHQFVVCAFP